MRVRAASVVLVAGLAAALLAEERPCSPHPFLPPASGFELVSCDEAAYAELAVIVGEEEQSVAGPVSSRDYALREGARQPEWPELLAALAASARKLGGSVTYDNGSDTAFLRVSRKGHEVWTQVTGSGDSYSLTSLEAGGQAPPDPVLEALLRDGRVPLGVAFAPGTAKLKPESHVALMKVAEALRPRAELRLRLQVRAHEAGSPEADRALAQSRAQAVATALAALGIGADRLTPEAPGDDAGAGGDRPAVELVKR
jgi:outer membrane protein OmpA-like peptidoglycan-associated protein